MNILLNGKGYSSEKISTVKELLMELEREWSIELSGAVVLVNDEIVKKIDGKLLKYLKMQK